MLSSPVESPLPAVQAEPVASPETPIAHVEDAEEPPATTTEILSELIRQSYVVPVPDVIPKNSAPLPSLSHRMVIGTALATFVCGVLLGLALRGSSSRTPAQGPMAAPTPTLPEPALPEKPRPVPAAENLGHRVTGTVDYAGPAGERRPDRAARVLLLPVTHPGETKLTGPALRVGANETDRNLLAAAASALGGGFTQANDEGHFDVPAGAPGRYGLLIASQHQSRPPQTPLTESCRTFLSGYFDRPEQVLGGVDYYFVELSVEESVPLVRDVHFQAH